MPKLRSVVLSNMITDALVSAYLVGLYTTNSAKDAQALRRGAVVSLDEALSELRVNDIPIPPLQGIEYME